MMKFKKICLILLSVCLFFSFASCGTKNTIHNNIKVWSASDTQKILLNESYDSNLDSAKIEIAGFQNEYENAQVIITPTLDIAKYTVTLSDITSSNGEKFAKENFKVFSTKYIEVSKPTTNAFKCGMYPDALLPFEKAIEYNENTVKANTNQSVYFECYIPSNQAEGTYSGNFSINADGENILIPVSVTVWGYILSDKVHSKSSFGLHQYWGEGGIASAEKDSTYDMYAKYYESLLSFRLSGRYMPASMEDIDGFIIQLRKYYDNPKCSNYILPYVSKRDDSIGCIGIDYVLYEKLLDEIFKISVEDNKNYFSKATTYFAMYDEIVSATDIANANNFYDKIYKLQAKIAQKWQNIQTDDNEFKQEIIGTFVNISQLMVTSFNDAFNVGITYCPQLSQYNNEQTKNKYAQEYTVVNDDITSTQNSEKWWYSALTPRNPYASYHLDDNGYSPIVYSWMQYGNNVVGNLYWSTTFYIERTTENNTIVYNALQDCYKTAMRFPKTNGDGFLFYPGAPYGLKEPVVSIRLQQIRDGLEEYDLLYALEEEYNKLNNDKKIDVNFSNVMQYLYSQLYYGTKVNTTNLKYESVRAQLADLIIMAKKTGTIITDATLVKDTVRLKVYTKEQNIEFNGKIIDVKTIDNAKIYIIEKPLTEPENDFKITLDSKYCAKINLGAKLTFYDSDKLYESVVVSAPIIKSKEDLDEQSTVKIAIPKSKNVSTFNLTGLLLDEINKATELVTIKVYASQSVKMVTYFTGNNNLALPVNTFRLEKGWNEIVINTATLNWNILVKLKDITIDIDESENNDAIDLNLSSIKLQ